MSPYGADGWFEARPRVAVQAGVAVPKPGKVTDPSAVAIIEAAEMETRAPILSRGRTYARAGQVLGVQVTSESVEASIQGSDRLPYHVVLTKVLISGSERIHASCTCPYTCDYDWCKHAAALAYVAAFLVDTQPATCAVWSGEQAGTELEVEPIEPGRLRRHAQPATFAQRIAWATEIVPPPE